MFSRNRTSRRVALAAAVSLSAGLVLVACAPSSAPQSAKASSAPLGISDRDYSLDALVAAAKKEGPITVTDTTGKIVDIAKAFSAKYGVKATGVKLTGQQQVEVATREAQAGTIKTDVLLMTDSAAAVGSLIPNGTVRSWMPPDLDKEVPAGFQDPLMVTQEPIVFAYNTEKYGATCPVDNIWALTDAKWRGKVALPDPQLFNYYSYWWNQMATHEDGKVKAAYEAQFGKPLRTDEDSATKAWVKALASNKPQITKDDDDAAAAVGAPGQSEPFIGLMSAAKFRDNADSGYKLGICAGMDPWSGLAYTKAAVIATGTKSPDAAKLFIHYMLTQDGIALETADGKKSTNTSVPIPADEPSGVADVWNQILVFKSSSLKDDLAHGQDWTDFWAANNN